MRVISGLRKGHKLKAPKGMDVRPTEDRIKESLFNIIWDIHPESFVLDLFAGSGSIGIEFLSRGAKKCYFVDNSKNSIDTIEENLKHTKFEKEGILYHSDYFKAINLFKNKDISFDYIYIDPPFRKDGLIVEILQALNDSKILNLQGLIIIEHEKELNLEDDLFGFSKTNSRNYGSKSISFYKYSH